MAATSLAHRVDPPALERWRSAPTLSTSAALAVVPQHEILRRFSAPSIVDERRASETDAHLSKAVATYHEAIKALRTCLKPTEVDAITNGTSEDLHLVADQIAKELDSEKSKGESLERIMHYATVFDILSQTNSQFGCLIWGLLKFVLIMSKNHQVLFHRLSDMLCKIGRDLPRVMLYRTVLPNDRMLDLISQLYAAIVEFLSQTIVYFQQNRIRKWMTALWSPFEVKFEKAVNKINEIQLCIENDVNATGIVQQLLQGQMIATQFAEMSLRFSQFESGLKDLHSDHSSMMFQNMRETLFRGFEMEAGLHDEMARTYQLTASSDWEKWFKIEQRWVPSGWSRNTTISQALSDAPDPQHGLQWISHARSKYPTATAVFLLWGRGMTAQSAVASLVFQIIEQRPHIISKANIDSTSLSRANLTMDALWSLFKFLVRNLAGIMIYLSMGSVGPEEFRIVKTFIDLCKEWDGPAINVTLIHPPDRNFVRVADCVDLDEIYDVHPGLCTSDALHQVILLEMNVHEDLSTTVKEALWETLWREVRYAVIGIALDQVIDIIFEYIEKAFEDHPTEDDADEDALFAWHDSITTWYTDDNKNDMREQIQRHVETVDLHLSKDIKSKLRRKARSALMRPRTGQSKVPRSFRERKPDELATPGPKPITEEERDSLWSEMKQTIRQSTEQVYCSNIEELIRQDRDTFFSLLKQGEDFDGNEFHATVFRRSGKWQASFLDRKDLLDGAIIEAIDLGFDRVVCIVNSADS